MFNINENVDFLSFPMYKSRMSLFESLPITENAIVFVGDSLTQRNQWSEFFPGETIINRGIDSDRSLGVLKRIDHIIALKPKKIFLMVGINDVYDKRDTEHILSNYEAIIQRIQTELPETKLYVQSLLPVNNSTYNHPIDNRDVEKLNEKIAELAKKYSVPFIDIYSHVLDGDELNAEYTVDGCHLSGKGYVAWVEQIKSYVLE